jgi:DNA primase
LLLQSGLLVQRESGEIVDRFRHRLIVPICRESGSVIAFGGRQMDPDQGGPKYLNSPETPIYSKSRTLYGLNLTKAQIRKSGFAVLVEGYFDFAQVFQSEAAPVVASCGTALTTQQAHLLRRFTSNIVLSFDPDAAGEGAATRSCEMLVTEGFDVNVVALDKGEDPDTFIRRKGRISIGAGYVLRGRISNTCWIRHPRAWISATMTVGDNSWARCSRWPPGYRMRRRETSSRIGSLTRLVSQKRSFARRFVRRRSTGAPPSPPGSFRRSGS